MSEQTIFDIVIVFLVVVVSATLHEAMHGFVAYWLGDDTAKLQGRLTLNPIKHIDPVLSIIVPVISYITAGVAIGGAKPVPFNPDRVRYDEWGAALVAIAGPLTNFFIAFILFGIGSLCGYNVIEVIEIAISKGSEPLLATVIGFGIFINLGLFVFNMIPVPPLDGSRVLYALAPEFVRRGMEVIEQYGLILVFAILIFANTVIGNLLGVIIINILNVFAKIFVTV